MSKVLKLILFLLLTTTMLFAVSKEEKEFLNKLEPYVVSGSPASILVVDQSNPKAIVFEMENLLLTEFGDRKNFKIVDRATLESVMTEYKFQMTGLVKDEDILEIGQLSGANYVIIKSTDNKKLIYRLVHAQSATVIHNMVVKDKEKKKTSLSPSNPFVGFTIYRGLGYSTDTYKESAEESWNGIATDYNVDVTHTLTMGIVELGADFGSFLGLSVLVGLGLYTEDNIVPTDSSMDLSKLDESIFGAAAGGRCYFIVLPGSAIYFEALYFTGNNRIIPSAGVKVGDWNIGAGVGSGAVTLHGGYSVRF